jgi:hypothetical protein
MAASAAAERSGGGGGGGGGDCAGGACRRGVVAGGGLLADADVRGHRRRRTRAARPRVWTCVSATARSSPCMVPKRARARAWVDLTCALCRHAMWLRDHCQCAQCYHPLTEQRLVDTYLVRRPPHLVRACARADLMLASGGAPDSGELDCDGGGGCRGCWYRGCYLYVHPFLFARLVHTQAEGARDGQGAMGTARGTDWTGCRRCSGPPRPPAMSLRMCGRESCVPALGTH